MELKYSNEWGRIAEQIATDYLARDGYVIRERNWRLGNRIEIDIIAQKGDTVVFVEVKARSGNWSGPLEAVDGRKIKRMVAGANAYLKREKHLLKYRFDIIGITGNADRYEMEHIKDAFLPPLRTFR